MSSESVNKSSIDTVNNFTKRTVSTSNRVNIENCLFHDNSLSFAGAALTLDYCNGNVVNCTFSQNSNTNGSSYYVSNLDINNSTITVKNCIFQSDDSGNEMISGGTLSYCLINGGAGGDGISDQSRNNPGFWPISINDEFVLFGAQNESGNIELWRSDGTADGT